MNKADAWKYLKKLRMEKDTCIIVGNGLSLKQVPDSFLEKYDTFGANRVYLREGFVPTYYSCVNPLVLDQWIDEIAAVESVAKFIAAPFADRVPGSYPLHSRALPHFSREPYSGIYEGHTVTFVNMQIAHYIGYRTVLLVGVDHRYTHEGAPNQELNSRGEDPNHFHPEYFGEGAKWNAPDLERSEKAYRMAKVVFESDNRRIVNLTADSALDVFDREDLEMWL